MYDSLVIANTVELLNGGVASVNPLCPGAMFRLQPGADPGAPQPTTDFVASLLLDGERPFGRRASNRTIKLPVWITAPTRQILAAAREVLQQAIDQDFFTITWTRDPYAGNPGNLPLSLIYDCFRAQPTVAVFNTLTEKELIGLQVQITIPALPYGRSATQTQVSFAAPVATSPPIAPPPSPVVLDSFSSISSVQCFQSTQCIVGPTSCCFDPDSFGDFGGQETAFTYQATFAGAQNLSGMTSLQFWFGLGSRYYANLEYHGKIHGTSFYFTLTDTSGNKLSFSRSNVLLPVSNAAQSPVFSRITVPVPQTSTTFNYSAVASYSLEIINRSDVIRRLSWVTAYLDNLAAYPGSQSVSPVTRGAIYTLYDVNGTARSPATMAFQQAPSPGTVTTITTAGAGTYTVPSNTTYLKVEAWGGGGAGAGMTTAGVAAGAGGGEYAAETTFQPVSPATLIPYVVGAGDTAGASPSGGQATYFGPAPGGSLQVVANGGGSVPTNSNAAGLGGSGSANSVEHAGGAGRANPASTFGGGGGSSGGTLAAGNTPMGSGSVSFTTPGTNSWTCPAGVFQVLATCWGGGGAGGGSNGAGNNGQGGGGGECRSGLVPVTPGNVYSPVVGAGGAGVSGGVSGNNGAQSSFTGDSSVQVIAKPGTGGAATSSSSSPSNGGTGGTGNVSGFAGGRGGPAYPYVGGGGSSAGPSASGNPGGSPGGAAAPSQGGAGGNSSGAQFANGSPGVAPGGGGGGTWNNAYSSGAGATGQVLLTYPASTGAPTSAGGTAVSGGGAGGSGGGSSGTNGSAGSAPGGGGGGAFSGGSAQTGGAGAHGQLKITPYAPSAFKTLIVHRPPLGAQKTFMPMVSVGGGGDAPDGTHQYTMPQPVTGVNADFGGTYTVYLINDTWSGGSGSATLRTLTVTVTQYEYAGGPGYSTSTIPVTLSPSQVTNGIVTAGVLTLPLKAVAPDNTGGYYTCSVTDTNTSDRFFDCLFLDTMGQTVVINQPTQSYITYYIDAPDPNVSIGRIMGSSSGRANAISVMDNTPYISGGPLYVEPADGDNQLFVYCADAAAPAVSLSYYATYYFDRFQ